MRIYSGSLGSDPVLRAAAAKAPQDPDRGLDEPPFGRTGHRGTGGGTGRREPASAQRPVFDLDTPAEVQGGHDGMYALVVPPLKARDRIRIARRLAKAGFADPAWARAFVGAVRATPDAGGPTVLQLSVPVSVVAGARPGHTTVQVGRAMTFEQSSRLARALGCLVDAQQRALARQQREWRPPTSPVRRALPA